MKGTERKTVALTIAGSDPTGGAGVQADLKTFAALGVYGASVVTAITAQDTRGVSEVFSLPPEWVTAQLDAVLGDLDVNAAKTGILCDAQVITALRRKIEEHRLEKLVVDPVLRAGGGGHTFMEKEVLEVFKSEMVPSAYLLTPNLSEASTLAGMEEIINLEGMQEAARRLRQMGARNILVKGGHLPGDPVDILFDGQEFITYEAKRRITSPHGTGCTLSAAVTAGLARGLGLQEAIPAGKEYLNGLLDHSLGLGGGQPLLDHLYLLRREAERYGLFQSTLQALEQLKREKIGRLIPEVQSNLGVALPGAQGPEDVLAVPGRIIGLGEEIHWIATPAFGASRHVAKIILTVLRHDPSRRAAMNLRYSPAALEACHRMGLKASHFNRAEEPAEVTSREGASLEWGTQRAIEAMGGVPDIIYDEGGIGKEPMIRVLGEDAQDLSRKVIALHRHLMASGRE